MAPIDRLSRAGRSRSRARPASPPPPLAAGDRLPLAEFQRRSEKVPEHVKCELLDGEVYMSAATRLEHGDPHGIVDNWLGHFAYATPGTGFSSNATVRLDNVAETQPDALLRILPEVGGLSRVEDGYCHGPVELVAEVAASSAAIDFHKKKSIYLRNAIREYVVLAVHDVRVFWFVLEGGVYAELVPDRHGVVRSRVFPGLWLDTRALVRGNGARVLSVLDRGLASPGHATFARELARKRRSGRRRKR